MSAELIARVRAECSPIDVDADAQQALTDAFNEAVNVCAKAPKGEMHMGAVFRCSDALKVYRTILTTHAESAAYARGRADTIDECKRIVEEELRQVKDGDLNHDGGTLVRGCDGELDTCSDCVELDYYLRILARLTPTEGTTDA